MGSKEAEDTLKSIFIDVARAAYALFVILASAIIIGGKTLFDFLYTLIDTKREQEPRRVVYTQEHEKTNG
jgi:hypothetical protein